MLRQHTTSPKVLVLTLLAALATAIVLVVSSGREASAISQAAPKADSQTTLQLSSAGIASDLGARQTL
jgi:hypothetical protein